VAPEKEEGKGANRLRSGRVNCQNATYKEETDGEGNWSRILHIQYRLGKGEEEGSAVTSASSG